MTRGLWLLALILNLGPRLDLAACKCAPGDPSLLPMCDRDLAGLEQGQNRVLFVATVKSASPSSWGDYFELTLDRLPPHIREQLTNPDDLALEQAPPEYERLALDASKELFLDLWADKLTVSERESVQRAVTEEELDSALEALPTPMKKRVEVEVKEVIVGDVPDRLVLGTGIENADCGVMFEENETYLIEARPVRDGLWSTSICSRTQHVRDAQEDLRALRAWRKGQQLGRRVYGYVDDWTTRQDSHPSTYPKIAGVRLKLLGNEEPREAITDSDGRFWFENLGSRAYSLEVDRPGWNLSSSSERRSKIDLTQSRCAELHISLKEKQATISGRVLPQPGEPLPKYLWIEAIPVNPDDPAPFDGTAREPDGRFEIDEIEPGSYYVAINVGNPPSGPNSLPHEYAPIRPYPPTYYPGVSDKTDAAVFQVDRGAKIELGDWILPPRLRERRLAGIVRMPDGSPAWNARIYLADSKTQGKVSRMGPTSEDGRFEFHVLERTDYELQAAYFDRMQKLFYKGTADVSVGAEGEVILTLEVDGKRPSDEAFFDERIWSGRPERPDISQP